MKHTIQKFHRPSTPTATALSLCLALFLALVLELGIFQFSYFTQNSGAYPETALDLSGMNGWNGEALAILPENPSVSFDGPFPADTQGDRDLGRAFRRHLRQCGHL